MKYDPFKTWDHIHLGQKVGVRWPDCWKNGIVTTFDRRSRTCIVTLEDTGSTIQIENPQALRPAPESM